MLKNPREGIEHEDVAGQIEGLKTKGFPLAYVGDVVGTGSSRKSATNSVLWYMGDDVPCVRCWVEPRRASGREIASSDARCGRPLSSGAGTSSTRAHSGAQQARRGLMYWLEDRAHLLQHHGGRRLFTD